VLQRLCCIYDGRACACVGGAAGSSGKITSCENSRPEAMDFRIPEFNISHGEFPQIC
jgi:hypothetical protein